MICLNFDMDSASRSLLADQQPQKQFLQVGFSVLLVVVGIVFGHRMKATSPIPIPIHTRVRQALSHHLTKIRMHLSEVLDGAVLNEIMRLFETCNNVINETLPLCRFEYFRPENPHLRVIILSCSVESLYVTVQFKRRHGHFLVFLHPVEGVWEIVWCSTLDAVMIGPPPSDDIVNRADGPVGSIYWELSIIRTEPMSANH